MALNQSMTAHAAPKGEDPLQFLYSRERKSIKRCGVLYCVWLSVFWKGPFHTIKYVNCIFLCNLIHGTTQLQLTCILVQKLPSVAIHLIGTPNLPTYQIVHVYAANHDILFPYSKRPLPWCIVGTCGSMCRFWCCVAIHFEWNYNVHLNGLFMASEKCVLLISAPGNKRLVWECKVHTLYICYKTNAFVYPTCRWNSLTVFFLSCFEVLTFCTMDWTREIWGEHLGGCLLLKPSLYSYALVHLFFITL